MTTKQKTISSPFKFIIAPLDGKQYNDTKEIAGKKFITSTSIEDAEDVQRLGTIVSVPMIYDGIAKVGDIAVCQHNVFRLSCNDQGTMTQSPHFIKDNLFGVSPELVYMIIRDGQKIAIENNVFVAPINYDDKWQGEKQLERIGIMKYPNRMMREAGISEGDRVVFRKSCEYKFSIDGEDLYMMGANRILAKLDKQKTLIQQ